MCNNWRLTSNLSPNIGTNQITNKIKTIILYIDIPIIITIIFSIFFCRKRHKVKRHCDYFLNTADPSVLKVTPLDHDPAQIISSISSKFALLLHLTKTLT